ncbi:hypothetical protein AVEN_236472-1 [Araneus ventricosus]|uniref:DUF4371 domain-containing protein n=1 Tax=Araneus ventricosus TaxID=182803 RepID=A0A4Y2RW04_ARAVE|nr:hypothetical protein AVEN_236472-1 [Araneus ventricosus]
MKFGVREQRQEPLYRLSQLKKIMAKTSLVYTSMGEKTGLYQWKTTYITYIQQVRIEEHVSLVKEPGSEYICHVSVNFGRAQITGNCIYSFLSCVDNDIDVTKFVAIDCDGTSVKTGVKEGIIHIMELILNRPLQWFVCPLHANDLPLRQNTAK